jgi:ankyrin repeat protein
VRRSSPTRALREHPNIHQLRRQAKELLEAFTAGEASAIAEIEQQYRDADPSNFALHDAQLVLARAYGFDSWPKLKAYVDGVTVVRLVDAVRSGDIVRVRAMLKVRPELVHMDMAHKNEHRALHYAVLDRAPEMVRVLMEYGADARKGIYPHSDATSALTIATERGYDEIVAIIQEEERHRRSASSGTDPETAAAPDELSQAIASGDKERTIAILEADPARVNPIEGSGGLLSVAVKHNRPDMLALLLDHGLDPNERTPVDGLDEPVISWGMPLWNCAASGKYAMAEMLLSSGADPNGQVYASGTPLYQAYGRADWTMVNLLERHGGLANGTVAGLYRQTELAKQLLANETCDTPRDGMFVGKPVAEELLWAAACGGAPEIVRMALEHVDWPRDDPRWFTILEQPLRIWNHGSGHWANHAWDRGTYLTCFRLVLERCDANIRGRFGLTILHSVAGSREHMTADERLAFATALLDSGARMDMRDDLLKSTPLGWACRWGRVELVKLLLERGADPVEGDAEPWATPRAWVEKMGRGAILAVLPVQPR